MLHGRQQIAFGQLRVDAHLEEVANMLCLFLVDELPLLGLDVSLLVGVELAALLKHFLYEVFGVAPQALDSFWHHEYLLDAQARALLVALLRLLQCILEASPALVDRRLAAQRQHDEQDNARILGSDRASFLETLDFFKDLVLATQPVERSRRLRLPIEDHHSDCRLVHSDGVEEAELDVAKLVLIGVLLEEAAIEAVLLLFVERRHLELAVWVLGRPVSMIELVTFDADVVLRSLLQLVHARGLRCLLPDLLHLLSDDPLYPRGALQGTDEDDEWQDGAGDELLDALVAGPQDKMWRGLG